VNTVGIGMTKDPVGHLGLHQLTVTCIRFFAGTILDHSKHKDTPPTSRLQHRLAT